jgi:aspartyl-tRNA synthetase
MTAGVHKYFQFARCFRDEDLRADRGFEFTQLDLEMSFVERDEVMRTINTILAESVSAIGGKLQQQQFPIFTYQQAMDQFGSDKFDLRSDQEKQDGVLAFAWVVDFPMFKQVNKKTLPKFVTAKAAGPLPTILSAHPKRNIWSGTARARTSIRFLPINMT